MTINITLPTPDIVVVNDGRSFDRSDYGSLKDWQYYAKYSDFFEAIDDSFGGLYIYYTNQCVLYVGRTISVKKRVREHFAGSTPLKKYIKDFTKVECIFVPDITDQEIYEAYAIKIYQPLLNIAKTSRMINDIGNHLSDEQTG
jgi:predicted GIY-YIG superfamily endonuclease